MTYNVWQKHAVAPHVAKRNKAPLSELYYAINFDLTEPYEMSERRAFGC